MWQTMLSPWRTLMEESLRLTEQSGSGAEIEEPFSHQSESSNLIS